LNVVRLLVSELPERKLSLYKLVPFARVTVLISASFAGAA